MAVQGGGSDKMWQIKKEVNALMDKEERLWRQRSRTLYLKDGDRNTKFFHCRATQGSGKTLSPVFVTILMSGVHEKTRLQILF